MKYFIITGTSRGLGQAIANKLVNPGHHLFCISRKRNDDLISRSMHGNIDYYEFDLNEANQIEELMQAIFSEIDPSRAEAIYLINNAAVISPLSSIEQAESRELARNLNVNLLAPMILTSLFIRFTQPLQIEKRILNVSSMSVKNHLSGMSAYSAAKAGLDVFSKCVGLEQGEGASAVKVVSVWPGIIDTSLQEEARNADKSTFASAGIFAKVHERGMLVSPEATAKKLVEFLLGESFVQGAVIEEL
ncbi:(S)-benzoin forming benzil reductase [Paenibacillus radicis (ex Xue et al. 2023)]|uniref:(S)-benzoin forming benzil reductase n=1 Tax=Paenibacillus radicis (ex Xue et al. 2023) TaxID=2972489 RepID=A0ABT1YTN1_9BACL|nr:(S)-benzoin forming benzil reductase [Paenibacillus radicis (ex Xue et al. 2023)]MCR8636065.1 (S)-benzoin forming benzil reductase [Paenibacillus radicis (ex Xue et al. 2023)]